MFKKISPQRTIAAFSAAALTALGVGGIAVAQNANTTKHPAQPAATVQPATSDTPDAVNETSATDTDNVQDQGGKDDATETSSGSEKPDAAGSEQADGAESGSEVSGADGPGGHADEPGNANADHQAQGAE